MTNMSNECPKCGANIAYSDKYDAFYCPSCNTWTEDRCSHKECEYCAKRPETPLNPRYNDNSGVGAAKKNLE